MLHSVNSIVTLCKLHGNIQWIPMDKNIPCQILTWLSLKENSLKKNWDFYLNISKEIVIEINQADILTRLSFFDEFSQHSDEEHLLPDAKTGVKLKNFLIFKKYFFYFVLQHDVNKLRVQICVVYKIFNKLFNGE